jgi:hypothetical protein
MTLVSARERHVAIAAISLAVACGMRSRDPQPIPPLPASAAQAQPAAEPEPPKPTTSPLGPVYAKALQGDLKAALEALSHVDVDALHDRDRAARECFVQRFERRAPPPVEDVGDPFVVEVVSLYRDYWTRVMLRELGLEAGEDHLLAGLRALLAEHGSDAVLKDLGAATAALGSALEKRGYHSIRGVTQPYWELMAWSTQLRESYEVELPETTITVKVVFMDGFATLGWTGYATCGKYFSGGWATKDALHCVRSAYDLESEDFEVSYLAHEGQHFADYVKFPKLEQPELEYRGKLTELAKAKKSAHALIQRFAATAGTDRSTPHNLANGWVARDMAAAIFGEPTADPARFAEIPAQRINQAAVQLLRASSKKLEARGAETDTRFADR